ncbi:MAG: 2-C-methyl-D-erythritol 2,4-cyclodiphosphate synthase [Thermomicrobiales bacterium]
MRIGLGYDIHAYSKDRGRQLVLGGVVFPNARALEGHSDADVVLHAICDAMLGAFGLGDIGEHFPPGDPEWLDVDSLKLLSAVREMMPTGAELGNIDVTVIAEQPKIGPRRGEMSATVAAALGIDSSRVSIKATTNEGLGAIGRGEGIAAIAVVLMGGGD